jgi:hypothetical protein
MHRSLLTSFPPPEKKEGLKEEKKKRTKEREIVGLRECCFSFLLKP